MEHKFTEILANLLTGLLAILVPIFALLISVLARAIEAGRHSLEENIKAIFDDIEEIRKRSAASPETAIKELQKAIGKYSWRRRKAQIREFFLSTRAAIYYPGALFLSSLALLVRPLASTGAVSRSDLWLIGLSCGLTVIGTGMLCGVLETVTTFAATYEPAVAPDTPRLRLRFSTNTSVAVWTGGSVQQCTVIIMNDGYYLAETILVTMFFPPQFILKSKGNPKLVPQGTPARLPGYMGVFWELSRLHAQVTFRLDPVEVTVPTDKGEYNIPARVRSARMRLIDSELKIIVS